VKISKNDLEKIIREQYMQLKEDQSWSDIAVDAAISALIESTYRFDPPQQELDILESEARKHLAMIKPLLDRITRS
tara:strand:- start:2529 stop:2756 length:228 start_codon:yes stop_codon:yes gene_type:complete